MAKRWTMVLLLLVLMASVVSAQISQEAQESSKLAQNLVAKPIFPQEPSKNPLDAFTEAPKILGIELPFFFEVKSAITSIIGLNKPVVLGSHRYNNGDTLTLFFDPNPNLKKLTVSPSLEIIFNEVGSSTKFSTKFFSMGAPGLGFSTSVNFGFG